MSQLRTDINLPSINSIDGFVTDGSMTTVMYSVENELDSIGNAVGNIYGTGDFQYDERKLINSLASSVGSELEDPALPYGVDLNNVVETHTLSGAKETALGLIIDTESSVTIEGFDNLNISSGMYTVSTDPYNMSDTECFIDGRLIFFKKPPYSFTIQYTGTYPTSPFLNKDGYLPNVIPNPKSEGFVKPNLSLSSGRVAVDIVTANAVKTTNTYQDQYDISFADYILPFVDGSGVTPCPKAYISAYKLNTISGKYDKLQVDNIYIISNTRFELDTDAEIDLDNDTIIISIANMSIKEWLIVALRELQNHKHDGSDMSSPLNHSDLAGLVPRSLNENINYAKSQIPNNDHPQYLNREGYSEDDNGTYRNAMLGDLFIASVNPDNLFNNIIERSNQIVFGATGGAGHSIYRESASNNDDLVVASETNGIRIAYEFTNPNKYAIGIQSGDSKHKIANEQTTNNLAIGSATYKVVFTTFNNIDVEVGSYQLNDIQCATSFVQGVNFGDISFVANNDNVVVGSESNTKSLTMNTKLKFNNNLISGGIVFDDSTNTYGKIYASALNGTSATAIDNHLVIASTGDIYLTKNVTESTTSIDTDTRAKLYAGDSNFYTVGTSKATDTVKNGIKFGEDHYIYMTTTTGSYAENILVVEANTAAIFVKPGIDITAGNPIYTDIHAANIIAHGSISGEVDSTKIVSAEILATSQLNTSVGCQATFNGPTTFNSTIDFNDNVTMSVLSVTSIGTINQVNSSNASIDNLVANISTNLKGQIVFSEHISNPSSFTSNVESRFNKKVDFVDQVTFTNTVQLTSSLEVQGTTSLASADITGTLTSVNANITNAVITNATIGTINIDTIVAHNINTDNLDTDTNGITVTGRIRQTGTDNDNVFDATIKTGGDIKITSTGKQLDMNNGVIKNVAMADTPASTDGVNVEYLTNQINTTLFQNFLSIAYPIGSFYANAYNPNNPGTNAGPFGLLAFGTWDKIECKMLVGDGTWTDGEGNTVTLAANSTGGVFKHGLLTAEMPSHHHETSYIDHAFKDGGALAGQGLFTDYGTGSYDVTTSDVGGGSSPGIGQAHENMPPYLVAYMWRRTA